MDIKSFFALLEHLTSVGVSRVVLTPDPENNLTAVQGSDDGANVIVFDNISEMYSDAQMCIQNTNALLSRLKLFDLEKASIEFVKHKSNESILQVTIKQGRRSATYRCASRAAVYVPSRIPDLNISGNPVVLEADYVDYLSKAISAITMTGSNKDRRVSMANNGIVSISVDDGEHDSFHDQINVEGVNEFDPSSWNVSAFQKVMKYTSSVGENKASSFWVTEHGIMVFDSSPVAFMIAPEVK